MNAGKFIGFLKALLDSEAYSGVWQVSQNLS
jgi:hypothetical protein